MARKSEGGRVKRERGNTEIGKRKWANRDDSRAAFLGAEK